MKKLIILCIALGILVIFGAGSAIAHDKNKRKWVKRLKDLSCAVNEIARFNGIKWECSLDEDTDTLGDLSCNTSQIAEYDGNQWVCGDKGSSDSPAGLPFILKDANGQQVGTIFFLNGNTVFSRVEFLTNNGPKNIILTVNENEIEGKGTIFFSNPGCQGDTFVRPLSEPRVFKPAFNDAVIAPLGNQRLLAFPADGIPPAQTPFNSQANPENDTCFTAFGSEVLIPAFVGPDLHTTFRPPYTLEVQ